MPAVPPVQGLTIWVEPVRVPSQVDQPQWLIRLEDETLVLLEQERWASPLRDELHQALLEILTRRFGAVDVGTSGASVATLRIRVEINRFELRPGEAWLDSTWLLSPAAPERARLRCVTSIHEAAAPGMAALAQAQRRAVVRLGMAIGEQLAALQRGEAGRCPG